MTAHEMLVKVRDLPPISRAALELGNLLGRPDTDNEEVVRVFKQDSVLTAKLLRACNSSTMALNQRVASVDQAVLLLGHARISQMATALAFRGSLAVPLQAYALEADDLWRHSLRAATAAQIAATEDLDGRVDGSLAFTIGLLHDIGKLITNEFLTRQSSLAILSQVADGCPLVEAERDVLGTDHAEVGAGLLHLWRLPDPILEAVALHHQPVLRLRFPMPTLAGFADLLAHRIAAAQAGQEAPPLLDVDAQLLDTIGIAQERIESLVSSVGELTAASDELIAIPA